MIVWQSLTANLSFGDKPMLRPVNTKKLSAKEYLSEINDEYKRKNIKSSAFVAPKLGSKGFGYFKIELKHSELVDIK